MDVALIRDFFMWCTITNAILLTLSSFAVGTAGEWVYAMQTKFIPMSRETFYPLVYAVIGVYKVLIIVFCAVPWVVLIFIG